MTAARHGASTVIRRLTTLGATALIAGSLGSCAASPVRQHARDDTRQPHPTVLGQVRTGDSPAPPSNSPSVSALLAPYQGRIPHFPRPPRAELVALPSGPRAGWYSRIPTTQPVAFITIDDGWTRLPIGPPLLAAAGVPVTLFLTVNAIEEDPDYFRELEAQGAVIEAHTLTHPEMRGMSYEGQREQSCGSADQLATWYGRRPTLFRPPYGDSDDVTLQAVHDCRMRAVVSWSETARDGKVFYQVGNRIQPGDIILMHFRPTFAADFIAILTAIHAAGLTPALLEDYIPGATGRPLHDPRDRRIAPV